MVLNLHYETALVKLDPSSLKLLYHIVWHGLGLYVLENELHRRAVRETTILLVESEVRGVQMYYE